MAIHSENYHIEINDISKNLHITNQGYLRLLQEAAGRASSTVRLSDQTH